MNCIAHPDRLAIANCVQCGNPVCEECKVKYENNNYCNQCINKMLSTSAPTSDVSAAPVYGNTSGMGDSAVVPRELGDWNWGGFLLTWIWGIGNNVWWSFLVFVPYVGPLVMPWVLAFKGNEWAWRSKKWDSIEHFRQVQNTWMKWGIAVLSASTLLIILLLVLYAGVIFYLIAESM